MDKEKSEQIKIALLGVIALMLIIKTVNMPTGQIVNDNLGTSVNPVSAPQAVINDMGGVTVQGLNPPPVQTIAQPLGAPTPASTSMTFDKTDGDLGSVSIGDNKTFTYNVTNTGTNPLNFNQLNADPGLTIVSQPTAAIAPGEKGKITVQLTAEAGTGPITKTIHVGSNTEPSHMHLTLAADVK